MNPINRTGTTRGSQQNEAMVASLLRSAPDNKDLDRDVKKLSEGDTRYFRAAVENLAQGSDLGKRFRLVYGEDLEAARMLATHLKQQNARTLNRDIYRRAADDLSATDRNRLITADPRLKAVLGARQATDFKARRGRGGRPRVFKQD